MSTFNHVNVLNIPTERSRHTTQALHLNKKGKNWIANNLVKEIRNLYSVHKIASPIVLPRTDAHEIIPQQDRTLKVCEISTSLGPVKDNINCLNPDKNHECQI
jgi:hypothetical protein